jgi:hypothetical protein
MYESFEKPLEATTVSSLILISMRNEHVSVDETIGFVLIDKLRVHFKQAMLGNIKTPMLEIT